MKGRRRVWVVMAALGAMNSVGQAISADAHARTAETPTVVMVDRRTVGRPIAPGFLGLSMEYRGIPAYAGVDPSAIDPVFLQLVRNLAPGQRPVLRIGGDSTDWTWWPVRGIRRPPGVRYALTRRWLQTVRSVATALDAHLILGVNLAADSRAVAGVEARALVEGIGRHSITALELGNEPELYGALPWYVTHAGRYVPARRPGWSFHRYLGDFGQVSRALSYRLIAGPATGSLNWMPQLGQFLKAEPRVGLLTVHRYALKRCGPSSNSTVSELLSNAAADGLASSVVPTVAIAHARRVRLRIDEVNSIACGGQPGVSNTFGAALWALDLLFAVARTGVEGVNFHTEPGAFNELFSLSTTGDGWQAYVHPEYYGLLMFAQAAAPRARLLQTRDPAHSRLRIWATRAADGRIRVVVINKYMRGSRVVVLRIPWAAGPAALERLRAPSPYATFGATLGGQSFGQETLTGFLAGPAATTTIEPVAHSYTLTVPAASAAMLTMNA
jgi:hypothetical protein